MMITKDLLERCYREDFRAERFLEVDPCGVVYELTGHTSRKLDIELGALFVAMISWGNRKAIRSAARYMLGVEMDWQPAEFVMSGRFRESYVSAKNGCVYRTLNRGAFAEVCENVRVALAESGCESLEDFFCGRSIEEVIAVLAEWLRPAKLGRFGVSACKRICMFLRWMVRRESPDLGLWRSFDQGDLYAVMDVHVCELTEGLTGMRQASWKSCRRLTEIFREWDAEDPLKYDVALMTVADGV